MSIDELARKGVKVLARLVQTDLYDARETSRGNEDVRLLFACVLPQNPYG